jgi:hypothetical protein
MVGCDVLLLPAHTFLLPAAAVDVVGAGAQVVQQLTPSWPICVRAAQVTILQRPKIQGSEGVRLVKSPTICLPNPSPPFYSEDRTSLCGMQYY